MYLDSKGSNHTVVQGSLREGFIRAILEGHLGDNAAWSTGQILGRAPENLRSGQLDVILHSGVLPQVHIYDGYIRLVPSEATIAVVEVKSEITTGKLPDVPAGGAADAAQAAGEEAGPAVDGGAQVGGEAGPAAAAVAPRSGLLFA